MIIRETKFKDYRRIKNLVNKNNLNIYRYKNWKKIWDANPLLLNQNINWKKGWVIEYKNRIVGCLSSIPTQYFLNKEKFNGSIISCWVVDAKYRAHSIKLINEFNLQKKIDFFIATSSNFRTATTLKAFKWIEMPNKDYNSKLNIIFNFENVYNSYIKNKHFFYKLFYKLFSITINFFIKNKINFWKKFKLKNSLEIYKSFNNEFDLFWKDFYIKRKNKFLFNRSSEWMNWHFYPYLNKKNFFIIVKKNNNKILGYAVCLVKDDKANNLKKAILVDICSYNKNKKIYFELILSSIKEAFKLKSDLFQMIGFDKKKREQMLKFRPFVTKNKFAPYLFKCINPKLKKILNKKKYWEPCSIDGDSIY